MPYYPKSQIKTNLYTNGTEYSTEDLVPYTGYYFKTSKGKLFTGRTPQDPPIKELFLIGLENRAVDPPKYEVRTAFDASDIDPAVDPQYALTQNVFAEYVSAYKTQFTPTLLPYFIASKPTEQDYQLGEFRRYFCKKSNELVYIEIDQTQYDLLFNKNPSILWQMYIPFNIPWNLTGNKEDVAQVNKNMVDLAMLKNKAPFLDRYLNYDYLKYYR